MDDKRGLYLKFKVTRTDGSSDPGGKHEHCPYFVLDVTHDPFAPAALAPYAEACRATRPALAEDIDRILMAKPAGWTMREILEKAADEEEGPEEPAPESGTVPVMGDEEGARDETIAVTTAADFILVLGGAIASGRIENVEGLDDLGTDPDGTLHLALVLAGGETRIPLTVGGPRLAWPATTIKIRPSHINLVLGPNGNTLRKIVDDTGVSIELDDTGTVRVASPDRAAVQKAITIIRQLTGDLGDPDPAASAPPAPEEPTHA